MKKQVKKITAESCKDCKAGCCKHVALPIEKPRSKQDYDFIRWYLLHQDVNVYIDSDKSWMIEFKTPCLNLDKNFQCKDYNNRPKICKDFPPKDELCEFFHKGPVYNKLFTTAEQLESFLAKKKKKKVVKA